MNADARYSLRAEGTDHGYPVQGWFAHEVSHDGKDAYEAVICLAVGACTWSVQRTGKSLILWKGTDCLHLGKAQFLSK